MPSSRERMTQERVSPCSLWYRPSEDGSQWGIRHLRDGARSSVYAVPCSDLEGENTRTGQGMKVSDLLAFLTLTIGLSLGLGVVMAGAYRVDVARNWSERRCDPGVVALAGFFKPSTDPRTARQFSEDNWSFCQKEYVEEGIRAAAAVPSELADAEGAVVGAVRDIAAVIADVFFNLWQFCHEAYSTFMDRMKVTAKLAHNFMIQLHSIVGRLQAAALSIIFGLIGVITAYISATQLVLIVAIVIIGILIALQIILFFILLPISGLIITATAIVSVTVVAIATAIAAAMVAELFTPGACFAAGTRVMCGRGRGPVPIESIRIGDVLLDGGVVTAVHRFRVSEQLYSLDGVHVTGDHLIRVPECGSVLVRIREYRESKLLDTVPRLHDLWCLTTSSRRIPVQGTTSAHIFADWEEIPDMDTQAQRAWHDRVWRELNPGLAVPRHGSTELTAEAGVSPDCQIPTCSWWGVKQLRRAMDVRLGDYLYTRDGNRTLVVGIVEIAGDQVTDAVELWGAGSAQIVSIGSWVRERDGAVWRHPTKETVRELHPVRWRHFYTAAGEFQIGNGEWCMRDASDVGLSQLDQLVDDIVLESQEESSINI